MAGLSHSVPIRARGFGVELLALSFRVNTTNAPDRIRDGKGNLVESVTRNSVGKYTVKLNKPRPRQIIAAVADIHQAATAVTKVFVKVNRDSYVPATGEFVVETVLDDGSPAVDDNPDDDVIHVILVVQSVQAMTQS